MKEPQKPIADIMLNWTESIRQAVPDNEERCRVYDYIFAECKRIDYGVPHELTKPDGAGGIVVNCIVQQEERMCSKYAEIEEKRKQNLTKANAAKALKRTTPTEEEYNEQF